MPSTKPQILIRTEQDLIDALDEIAKEQKRSRANLCEIVLSQYVEQYKASKNQESLKSQILENEHKISQGGLTYE